MAYCRKQFLALNIMQHLRKAQSVPISVYISKCTMPLHVVRNVACTVPRKLIKDLISQQGRIAVNISSIRYSVNLTRTQKTEEMLSILFWPIKSHHNSGGSRTTNAHRRIRNYSLGSPTRIQNAYRLLMEFNGYPGSAVIVKLGQLMAM